MSDMLESYDLSCEFNGLTKDYTLKFKVAKGVKVTFSQAGDINKIDLTVDDKLSGGDNNKKYKVTGPLNVEFVQSAKGSSELNATGGPVIKIEP